MTTQTNTTPVPTLASAQAVVNFFQHPSDVYNIMKKHGDELWQLTPVQYLEPYWLSANSETKKLKFDLSAAPICFSMEFWEWVQLVLKPQLEGEFEGLRLIDSYSRTPIEYQMHNLESPSLQIIVLCYETDAENEVIEEAHDLEISIHWHKDMTNTDNAMLIENLLSDMCDDDFTIAELNQYLALIGNPDE